MEPHTNHRPLVLPIKLGHWTRVVFYESDSGLLLTDRSRYRQAGALLLAVLVGVPGALMLLAGLTMMVWYVGQSATGPVNPTDLLGGAIISLIIGAILFFVCLGFLAALNLHRSFRIEIDFLDRTCVCKSRCFGWTVDKREVDTRSAFWDGDLISQRTEEAQRESAADVAVTLILYALGPLGWIIEYFFKGDKLGVIVTQNLFRLALFADEEMIAFVNVPDLDVAEGFLLAWDQWIDGRPKRG